MCLCLCLVTRSCPTLCSLPGYSAFGDSLGRNIRVGCHALLQGIFPTQGSNPGLTHITGRFFTNWATREAHKHACFTSKQTIPFFFSPTNIYRVHVMTWHVERQWLETINMAPKSLVENRYPNNHQLNVKIANIITSLAPKLCQNNSLNTYSNSKIKILSSYNQKTEEEK